MNRPLPAAGFLGRMGRSQFFWVGVLYFAEGFPYGVFFDVFPVWFRQQGVDLRAIGALSLLGLAWTLKFLWAPAVDRYRHHRRWMALADWIMAAVMMLFAAANGSPPWVFALIALFTVVAATNDIAIDGYTIELLDADQMGMANGVRNGLYRVGIIAAGFALAVSSWVSWTAAFGLCAGILVMNGLAMLRAPAEPLRVAAPGLSVGSELAGIIASPRAYAAVAGFALATLWLINRTTQWSVRFVWLWPLAVGVALLGGVLVAWVLLRQRGPAPVSEGMEFQRSRGPVFGALFALLERPGIAPVLAFILLYKLGDAAMAFMIKPFWVDHGFSAAEIGMVSVNLGLGLAILGGLVGGWYTDRAGIFRALWVLGLAQALSNLLYALVAWSLPESGALAFADRAFIYTASALESFTGGLGSASFLAFLMAIVDKRRSAAEYALLSSIFALSRSLAGWASGFGAQQWGYGDYFMLTFLLSFPAFALLPAVAQMLSQRSNQSPISSARN